jgi:phospholipase C
MQSASVVDGFSQTGAGKIKHIIYIVQEGRSFDNLFQGYPGADTVSEGEISSGKTVQLKPASLAHPYEIDHSASAMFAACNGTGELPGTDCRMNGFDEEETYGGPAGVKYPQYVYVPHEESKPYFAMAHEWVVADKMFASQLDGDFTAHQYIIAAQAGRAVNTPDGAWGCGGGQGDMVETLTNKRTFGPLESACFHSKTLGDELDKANLSWRFYTSRYGHPRGGDGSSWSSYASIKGFYGSSGWDQHVISPQKRFFTDVADGKLANLRGSRRSALTPMM